jgi:muconolactone delta-isomerase
MHFLVISTPRADQPSAARGKQTQFWDWLAPLKANGTAKHVYTKLGRGAVIIFDVDSHETMHKLVNQWSECVPATFEVQALLPAEHQERIARAGTNPMGL